MQTRCSLASFLFETLGDYSPVVRSDNGVGQQRSDKIHHNPELLMRYRHSICRPVALWQAFFLKHWATIRRSSDLTMASASKGRTKFTITRNCSCATVTVYADPLLSGKLSF